MRILDRSVYVGPSLYAHFPVIRLELDLGELEAWPTGRLGGEFVDALAAALPGLARARLLVSRARRLLPAHARGRRHLARPRARARRDRAAEHRGRERHLRQDAQRGHARRLHGRLRIRAARRRHRGRRARRCGCCARCCPRRSAPADSVPDGWNWPEARDEFIRFAQRRALGPVDGVAGARRRSARHSVAAPQRPVAGAARPRQVPAAHPGHGHRPHLAHRRRTRERQGRDQQDPRDARPAGAAAGTGAERRPGGARRAAHRLSGRHQALQRQPRPRHFDPPDDRRGSRAGLRGGARAFALGDRRDLPRGRRPSPAGRQRRAGRGHAAHAGPRRRRRRSTRSRS